MDVGLDADRAVALDRLRSGIESSAIHEYLSVVAEQAVGDGLQAETLASVGLCDTSGKGRSWADWSREEERRREERHAQWLRDVLGRRTTFAWGTVWSGHDEKGGSAVIVIRYAR